jgi:hypothetical protein
MSVIQATAAASACAKTSPKMADYEVYVDDNRYQVPSLYLISASDEARARAIADEVWRSSAHHRGVELRRDGERLLGLGSLAPAAARP